MNMSYCRFQNTLSDLKDCNSNLMDDLDGDEFRARRKLIELCVKIANDAPQVLELEEVKEDEEETI